MKRNISLALVFVLLVSLFANLSFSDAVKADEIVITANEENILIADQTIEEDLRKGYEITQGQGTFRVIKDGVAEVEFVAPSSTKNTFTVPSMITYNGRVYNVTKIAAKAMYGNKDIRVVELPNSITVIGKQAFQNCTSLLRVTLPEKLTTINAKAFYGCKKLDTIEIKSTSLKTIGKYAFGSVAKKAKFKLPADLMTKYKNLLKKSKVGKLVVYKKL